MSTPDENGKLSVHSAFWLPFAGAYVEAYIADSLLRSIPELAPPTGEVISNLGT
jgi:hypothetical protein